MSTETGLRERKKQRTRSALVQAAIALFTEQGYEQTTVAQIAAAADVSTRTFFDHFPTKEDVLFVHPSERTELVMRMIADCDGSESPSDLLVRVLKENLFSTVWNQDILSGAAALRFKLLKTVPAIQVHALRRMLSVEDQLTDALCSAFPDRLTPYDAAVMVGSTVGGILGAMRATVVDFDDPEKVRATLLKAIEVTARGLRHFDGAPSVPLS
ncbi:TetR/AcrR family transcriptional regulator [Allokutzneria sp. A3M-2-11 16]|uniref:TetR/AcrR family transcriptional regulator n=1 Tax=Allokutzneria sp. A3M-2-11 16 TaxID=2962043 RepID=UPI0020B857A8|nr:TetR/AcrR family transcriptional regulator [Allokutzneria sp. A3M-2-11 16]MCP3798487.1 TetR/AcrR family transcriptional regulator [Allokutzneria sp. A3M-2-11 16]